MTISDNLTAILLHAPLREIGHGFASRKTIESSNLAIKWCCTRYLNDTNATHVLVRVQHVPIIFRFKYSKVNVKIPKHPYDSVNYTKYMCESTKIPLNANLFFFLSHPKLNSYLHRT
jgi:hypothetical protein